MQKRVTINIIGHKEETSLLKRFLDNSTRKQGRKHFGRSASRSVDPSLLRIAIDVNLDMLEMQKMLKTTYIWFILWSSSATKEITVTFFARKKETIK